jgi:hypothetical protein
MALTEPVSVPSRDVSPACASSRLLRARSDRIDASEKDLTAQQKVHRDEIGKIQETAKQIQQAAVQKQTQASQLMEGGQ